MRSVVVEPRDAVGVAPTGKVLRIAPSGYRRYAARRRHPALCGARAQRADRRSPHLERVWEAHRQASGADPVWKQLHRAGESHEKAMSNGVPDAARPPFAGR